MKKAFFIFFMVCLCHAMKAQNIITGKVLGQDQRPLSGATVYIHELNKGTATDAEGRYRLNNLPKGQIKVQFSHVGYNSNIKTLQLMGVPQTIDVTLLPANVGMDEVVVTSGYHSDQRRNAVKIDVLSLDATKGMTSPNLMEKICSVPGVDMISKGSGVTKPVIRGLSMNDVLVLNNGVRHENYQYSDHHPLGISEYGVEKVEIVKGPVSLLYGSDAIGGVINFVQEKPAPIGSITGDYNVGLFSNTRGMTNNLGIKGASGKFFGGIRAGHSTHADFRQGGGAFAPNTRFNEWSVKGNAGYTGKKLYSRLSYEYGSQKLGLAEEEAFDLVKAGERKNSVFYQRFNSHLLSSQNRLFLGKYKMEVNAAYQSTDLAHVEDENEVEIEMRLATLTYEAKLFMIPNDKSEYVVGFQGFNQKNLNLNGRPVKLLPNATVGNQAAFALLQHEFFESLRLQAGVRYDFGQIVSESIAASDESSYRPCISKHHGSLNGSIGGTYTLNRFVFRANFATAYRSPNLAELTSDGLHELRYEKGDANLLPEKSRETDAGIRYHSPNVTLNIAAFYNKVNNYIFIAPTGDTTNAGVNIYQYRQVHSILFGGEAGLQIHPATMKWLQLESTYAGVVGKQENGKHLPFVPAQKLSLALKLTKEKMAFLEDSYFSARMTKVFDQNKIAHDETATKGYLLVDLSTGTSLRFGKQSLQMELGVKNLFDVKYIDHLSTLKEAALLNPGRNVTLSLKVPF